MLHEAFHVIFFVAFLASVAGAFVGLVAPLVLPGKALPIPPLQILLLMAAASGAGLAADWILHNL